MSFNITNLETIVTSIWDSYLPFVEKSKIDPFNCFYHQSSGLHNEGNWHNSIMGIVYVKLYEQTKKEIYKQATIKLANSLFELNFDLTTKTFRMRTHSVYFDHSTASGYLFD
eukprot:TRINITY_DN2738_c1_g1_i4.p1 TRINITY_DN2738_c1_g1~~TRINITY_DN2738_c1_g1_i4.p1  ORF type:complete len:112 (-),score=31.76 TRINITY_DN2738_c1_g1_i4:11-346(-)